MIDSRQDYTRKTNTSDFWSGFGAFKEGVWYDGNPYKEDAPSREQWHTGWCFALTEGKWPKPWWKSKLVWQSLAEAALGGLLVVSPPEMLGGTSLPGFLLVAHGTLIALLRRLTSTPMQ